MPVGSSVSVETALGTFAAAITRNFSVARANPAQPEDQLKGPTQTLIQTVGKLLNLDVVARTEASAADFGARPDIGVTVDGLLTGHVELKATGKGANPAKFTDEHDKAQWAKLRDHPNLVYTDGDEWALFHKGERSGPCIKLSGSVLTDGSTAVSPPNAHAVESMFQEFLRWQPLVPTSPRALAEMLAPLCRLLRSTALDAVSVPDSALSGLAREWRDYLFPDADDQQFADAYAQTVTYALLLARFEGESDLHSKAADALDARHGLLAQVLRILADPQARGEVEVPVSLLERSIAAIDLPALARRSKGADPWLYFYEDFLAAYDPKLRKNRGVYYTPTEVVSAQVRFVAQLLEERFGKPLTYADDGVTLLDPACGTGTYLLAAISYALDQVREKFGDGAVSGRATIAAENSHGFEILIGPYAVAHLRAAQQVLDAQGSLPSDGVHVYLTDTLDNPFKQPDYQQKLTLTHRKLTEEHVRANKIKATTPILVCLGNPPYYRQTIGAEEEGVERQGGWVRNGTPPDPAKDITVSATKGADGKWLQGKVIKDTGTPGMLEDFLQPAIESGKGGHLKNLYNLYVYFWRWALWKVFESTGGGGIVSFITASSYLRGPGFVGMRQKMREEFDDLWLIDLEGEGRGARRSENVFDIQTPVVIAVGVRAGASDLTTPARVRYARVTGSREEKLARLAELNRLENLAWKDCYKGWMQPFLPEGEGDFFDWPALTDIFPWQHSGAQFKRKWPIAPERATLVHRWKVFAKADAATRRRLLVETPDRKLTGVYRDFFSGEQLATLASLPVGTPHPAIQRYSYRGLDREWAIVDNRLIDRPRPDLWRTNGPKQVFMTSLPTGLLGEGPAAMVAASVPDLHHFRGSFGAKDVIPLWVDAAGSIPNVTSGLLATLETALEEPISPEALFAYCYGVLSAPSYTSRFADELAEPGPHVPISSDHDRFAEMAELGRRLIWLHTFGDRFLPKGKKAGDLPRGVARCALSPAGNSLRTSYDESTQSIHIGSGRFEPVSPAIWHYNVSGYEVVKSWIDRRTSERSGRKSSDLDDIRPQAWTAEFTEELLRLLWILEATVDLGPKLDDCLNCIVAGRLVAAGDLPKPAPEQQVGPTNAPDAEVLSFDFS